MNKQTNMSDAINKALRAKDDEAIKSLVTSTDAMQARLTAAAMSYKTIGDTEHLAYLLNGLKKQGKHYSKYVYAAKSWITDCCNVSIKDEEGVFTVARKASEKKSIFKAARHFMQDAIKDEEAQLIDALRRVKSLMTTLGESKKLTRNTRSFASAVIGAVAPVVVKFEAAK